MKASKEKNEDPFVDIRTEQIRLIRRLIYGFVDYSSFEKVIESFGGPYGYLWTWN